jgi:hypothetical protein
MLTARGEAHSTGNECLSAHRLAWVDPETGKPLELELRRDEAFRGGLEYIEFGRVARMKFEPTPKEHTNMNTNKEYAAAAQSYADAHASHYTERDYPAALRSYDQLIALHPSAPEAEYARTQIRNIVKSVIPAKELLAAELELVLRHLRPDADSPAAVSL